MGRLEDFETKLKEVVQAKHLSASKMSKLTEIALKSMKDDTQLVSILYRTHKSLSASAKVSSLYVFDALSRAAKHQANKQDLTGDLNAAEGNCATFLLRIEGVLESLFQDMMTAGTPELKEKAKKILDIWVKGNTFPSAILTQLTDVLKSKETVKEPILKSVATSDPRVAAQARASATPPTVQTPPIPPQIATPITPKDPQSALLALLTQAVNAGTAPPPQQTPPNTTTTPPGPQLDIAQLALLQQLTQTAQIGTTPSYPNAAPFPLPSITTDITQAPSAYRDDSRSDPHYKRYSSPDRKDYDNYHSGHGSPRGGFRGGRGRWDGGYRDGRGFRGTERSPPRNTRRSRSRSPPSRYKARGGRVKPYSPPRRPSMASMRDSRNTDESHPRAGSVEKDEFGRDIRAQSPETIKTGTTTSQDSFHAAAAAEQSPVTKPNQQSASFPTTAPISANVAVESQQTPSELGLEHFNIAMFDFTSPSSWEALGKMWFTSNGSAPTTEQLMQFVMLASTGADPSQVSQEWDKAGWSEGQPAGSQGYGGHSTSAGGAVGAGNGGHNITKQWNNEGANTGVDTKVFEGVPSIATDPSSVAASGGTPGGRMQRVGDRWMFVRDSGISL